MPTIFNKFGLGITFLNLLVIIKPFLVQFFLNNLVKIISLFINQQIKGWVAFLFIT